MLLSKSSEYAIRLVFHLVKQSGEYIRLKNAAKVLEIPYYQLAKVANVLIRNKILQSHTGPRGGVTLNKDIDSLSLIDIVKPLESDDIFERCVLGLSVCGDENPCPIHDYWKGTKEEIKQLFTVRTVKELIEMSPSLSEGNIFFSDKIPDPE